MGTFSVPSGNRRKADGYLPGPPDVTSQNKASPRQTLLGSPQRRCATFVHILEIDS